MTHTLDAMAEAAKRLMDLVDRRRREEHDRLREHGWQPNTPVPCRGCGRNMERVLSPDIPENAAVFVCRECFQDALRKAPACTLEEPRP